MSSPITVLLSRNSPDMQRATASETIGGIYGRVISLKEDSMVIESKSDHGKLTIARWALQQNLTVHDDTPKK